jgi:hypothetical protein
MRFRYLTAALVSVAVGTLPAAAQDEPISSKGRWRVDFERSFNPWAPLPQSVILDIKVDDGTRYEATETVITTDGKVRTATIRAAYDGKPYPVEGSPHGLTVAMTRLAAGTTRAELRTPDGLRAVIMCSLSADLNTMTCDGIGTDRSSGANTSARSVYVRD